MKSLDVNDKKNDRANAPGHNRAIQVQDPAGNIAINRYDPNGQRWQVTHQYKKADGSFVNRPIVGTVHRILKMDDGESWHVLKP